MARFLTGNRLNTELENLFEKAEQELVIISPFIKLHERYISALKAKITHWKLRVVIVFGKNEDDYSRSMKKEDFNFFKEFPNIEIRYERRLHAKYYASEFGSILTSMNLYTYSQDNNIEAGLLLSPDSVVGDFAKSLVGYDENPDSAADVYFKRVVAQADLLFKKTPEFEVTLLGLSKKYKTSIIEVDKLTDFFSSRSKPESHAQSSFQKNVQRETSSRPPNAVVADRQAVIARPSSGLEYISTSALAKEMGVSSKELFSKLESVGWIRREQDTWVLTTVGIGKGAQMKKGQYGEYISWPSRSIDGEIK